MIIDKAHYQQAQALSKLSYCNPFSYERIELEREVLKEAFIYTDSTWHKRQDRIGVPPNIELTTKVALELADEIKQALIAGGDANDDELTIYQDIVYYILYNTFHAAFHQVLEEEDGAKTNPRQHAPFFDQFHGMWKEYLNPLAIRDVELVPVDYLFACFYQLRRAFHFIYDNIIGGSSLSVSLRATVWESIFTHDMRRYRRSLTTQMGDITTLITGPSGTGKDLVAQSIGLSRFIPFKASSKLFAEDYNQSFYPLNLSALSPTLIESELFGHRKGSFTGAIQDRKGWFSLCSPFGSVFLDEIGECEESIQVKLLRVLQSRTFQPVGDVNTHQFKGKIIAATNRDLKEALDQGDFREDLYYRLCADVIQTPSLKEQIQESSEHLHHLVLHLAYKVVGEREAEMLAEDTETFIHESIGLDYEWPGNVRELEQCVRNILIRKKYSPHKTRKKAALFVDELSQGTLTADQVLIHYLTMLYAQLGNYEEVGRRVELDGRTVKSKVDPDLLRQFQLNQ